MSKASASRGRMSRDYTALSIGIVLLLAGLGFFTLNRLLHEVRLHDVRAAWHALPAESLAMAILFTVLSYLALTLYDVLALRAIGRPLPYRTSALASFTSYTLSHNLGLSLLTGSSARYRVYSAAGLGVEEIARIVLIASFTFWSGAFALAGAMLIWRPEFIAYDGMMLTAGTLRGIGILLLGGMAALLAWAGRRGRTIRFGRWTVPMPPARHVAAQIGVGVIDLAAASTALFVLVPGVGIHAWPAFFIGYVFAIIAVLVTHVPGGVGVFEAIMLIALPGTPRPQLVAALLAYRLIYYIAPLLTAVVLIIVQEGRRWHRPIARTLRGVQVVASGLAPVMMAALVFLGGTVLLVSGSLPAMKWRVALLHGTVPLPFMEASHMAGSLVGAALLILSAGLYRRLDGAFWLTRILLLAGALFSLLKGLDYEEAVAMILIAGALQWARPAFYRRTRLLADAFSPNWLATVAVVIGLSFWIGLFAYKHVDYQTQLWWRFAVHGDASRFLRASFAVAVLLASVAFARLFRPGAPRQEAGSAAQPSEAAFSLADRADANLAFTGDKRFLVSDSGQSFLMFQIKGHSWIVMGDPVGAPEEWFDLLWQLREQADAAQGRLLLYQISADTLPIAIELGLRIVKYGEEAHVDLARFSLEGAAARPLRYAERRAAREGATFEIIPAPEMPDHMHALAAVSAHWLKSKRHREKGFSVGRFDPAYIARSDCAVVRWHGRIVAFANIWTTPNRGELSVDLMRHQDEIPYGTMDFLFAHLMLWGQEQGYRRFNLGMAPLSGLEARRLSPLWSKLGALLYQHGSMFYGFEGLRAYKEKFLPLWEPRFVAGPQGISFARTLVDLQALIGSNAPDRSRQDSHPPTMATKPGFAPERGGFMSKPRMRRTAVTVLTCAALLATGMDGYEPVAAKPAAVRESSYTMAPFGRIAVYRPAGQPRATALFLSGDSGWSAGNAATARQLAGHGVMVAGVSTPRLMASLEHARVRCINPNYPLMALARDVQHRTGVRAYMKPVVIGYSAGATIAYAGLAQWPNASYRGVFSLGFSNDMPGRKPWCRTPGFNVRPIGGGPGSRPSRGWLFGRSARIKVPWIVLQGGRDRVVDFAAARRFVASVPGARMIALPNVDHYFADHGQWLPQMMSALAPMLNPIGRRADGLPRDLPVTVIPATGQGPRNDVMAVIYSGDGGWAGIDRDIAGQLSARGIPVVGLDSLSYFWSARTPAGAARDLSRIIAAYGPRWHRTRVMLIGYSFGADTLPAIVGSLDQGMRARIDSLSLLGLSSTADFQFHLASWLNMSSAQATPTVPAIVQLKGMDIRCVRGVLEKDSACDGIPEGIARTLTVPGDHHFNRNARLLTQILTT